MPPLRSPIGSFTAAVKELEDRFEQAEDHQQAQHDHHQHDDSNETQHDILQSAGSGGQRRGRRVVPRAVR